MWKGKGRSGYGESSTLGDYDDWYCLSRNGKQWKNPITMETRDLSGADYWHMRKQLTDSYDVPEELHAVNETVNLAHTLPSGKANLAAYGDPVPVRKPISKVSIKDKILPQLRRLNTLRAQMVDLETEYKTTNMKCAEYSMLRDVLFAKVQRQEVLLKRAQSIKPTQPDEDDIDLYTELPEDEVGFYATNDVSPQRESDIGCQWIDDLSSQNSLKNILKKACIVTRKLVEFNHKVKAYYQTLKEV